MNLTFTNFLSQLLIMGLLTFTAAYVKTFQNARQPHEVLAPSK